MSDLPRIYQLSADAVRHLPHAEQDAIWEEYREYWRGYEGMIIKRSDHDVDLDLARNVNRDDWVTP